MLRVRYMTRLHKTSWLAPAAISTSYRSRSSSLVLNSTWTKANPVRSYKVSSDGIQAPTSPNLLEMVPSSESRKISTREPRWGSPETWATTQPSSHHPTKGITPSPTGRCGTPLDADLHRHGNEAPESSPELGSVTSSTPLSKHASRSTAQLPPRSPPNVPIRSRITRRRDLYLQEVAGLSGYLMKSQDRKEGRMYRDFDPITGFTGNFPMRLGQGEIIRGYLVCNCLIFLVTGLIITDRHMVPHTFFTFSTRSQPLLPHLPIHDWPERKAHVPPLRAYSCGGRTARVSEIDGGMVARASVPTMLVAPGTINQSSTLHRVQASNQGWIRT